MARKYSSVAPDWWDYTTLDSDLIESAAKLTPAQILDLSRTGFEVMFYESLEEFYLAEVLEYVAAWRQTWKAEKSRSGTPAIMTILLVNG
jgi:glucosamine-6-phosphate deaminase